MLNLSGRGLPGLAIFAFCNPVIQNKGDLLVSALLVYAVYNATNHVRFNGRLPVPVIRESLKQWLREGTRGHAPSTFILDRRFPVPPPSPPLRDPGDPPNEGKLRFPPNHPLRRAQRDIFRAWRR